MTDERQSDERLKDEALRRLIAGDGDRHESAARLAFWQEVTAGAAAPSPEVERLLAADILAARGKMDAATLRAARGPMLVRAASRLRAMAEGGPEGPGDSAIEIAPPEYPHRGFFSVETLHLRHRRYDGRMSAPLRREVFVMTDAVTVLPYDPAADTVLVVEQLRAGPIARGGGRIWQREAIAGRIDPEETPEEAARREAVEEGGVVLDELIPITGFYPSPGAISEYIYCYLALATLPPPSESLHGLAEEGEDIRAMVWTFDRAMEEVTTGGVATAPLLISLLWLQRERERLRKTAV